MGHQTTCYLPDDLWATWQQLKEQGVTLTDIFRRGIALGPDPLDDMIAVKVREAFAECGVEIPAPAAPAAARLFPRPAPPRKPDRKPPRKASLNPPRADPAAEAV